MIAEKIRIDLGIENLEEKIRNISEKDYRLTFYERIDCLIESESLFAGLSYPIRYAETLQYTVDHMSIIIKPDESITGMVKEIVPTEEQISTVHRLSEQWWHIPLPEIQEKILWFYSFNWLRRRPPWFYSFGHLGLQWRKIISLGLHGFLAEAEARLQDEDVKADPVKADFIRGCMGCYRALSSLITRYGEEAGKLAARAGDAGTSKQYRDLSELCMRIRGGPAETFREALQLLWFIVFPLMKVCGCGVFDLGRMDQYLYPLYVRDVREGRLTEDSARGLLVEFFLKNNEIMSPADHMSIEDCRTDFTLEMTFDDPNYIIIGGLLPGGKPGVNELTRLFVEAQHALKLRNPFIVLRYYSGIDETFWSTACKAMRDNATIVVYNDNTMIPALMRCGIREADAFDYGFYGCNDPDITGRQGGLRQFWFNLVKPLEIVLNPSKQRRAFSLEGAPPVSQFTLEDRMIGLMTADYGGPPAKSLDDITSMEELLNEYRKQVRFLLTDYRNAIDKDIEREKVLNKGRLRIEDCFLEGPVSRALTWNDGGTPYNIITLQGSGLATLADSLAVLSQLVFREKELTLAGMTDILSRDFAGYEGIRTRVAYRTPKFGNDVDWVDELAAKAVGIFCDEVALQNEENHLYRFLPTLSTDRDFTGMGKVLGATPDGRRAGEPMSENQSPSLGMDRNGLTALLNSVSALPFDRITGGPLNLRIHPSAVQGENGLRAFAALLRTYFEKGGMQTQINVVSREELLEAQADPDKYRNLCVRVTGYSAYFVQMGKKAQDELIERTEHV